MPLISPGLWIIATPIGNIGDLAPRARHILENVDLVLAEDTRRAYKLFRECNIKVNKIESFFEHNEEARGPVILEMLKNGASIALVTDAGTPLLADPGYRLVRASRQAHVPVSPVPGPSAPMAALSAAGLPPLPFTFLGFLPRSQKNKTDLFRTFANVPGTLIFFDRKDRLQESLEAALQILGDRELAICRELTKEHEEFILGRLKDYKLYCTGLLGELTILLGPPENLSRTPEEEVTFLVARELSQGVKPRQAAVHASKNSVGWTASEIYNLINKNK